MPNQRSYNFGPFVTDRWHHSYYKTNPELKLFFPPHVEYIAYFINFTDGYFDNGSSLQITVSTDERQLPAGPFSFSYELLDVTRPSTIEVKGYFFQGQLHGDYSITEREDDETVMVITANFVNGQAHGHAYRRDPFIVEYINYEHGKAVGPSFKYEWLEHATRDFMIELPSKPYPYFPQSDNIVLRLKTFADYIGQQKLVFVLKNDRHAVPVEVVNRKQLPQHVDRDLIMTFKLEDNNFKYLSKETVVDNETQEVLSEHVYRSPKQLSSSHWQFKPDQGPAAYCGLYQKYGLTLAETNNRVTPSFVPYANEISREFSVADTHYDISYNQYGTATLIMVDDAELGEISFEFDSDGNILN